MKKISILFVILLVANIVNAQFVTISTTNKRTYEGEFISVTDTTITIKMEAIQHPFSIPSSKIVSGSFSDGSKIFVEDEKILIRSKEELKQIATELDAKRMGDPNYAVGKAMKSIGNTSLIIGVPTLAIGTILLSYGISKQKKLVKEAVAVPIKPVESLYPSKSKYEEALEQYSQQLAKYNQYVDNYNVATNCAVAGEIMFPVGASMTLIAIPLCIKGKQLMNLNINYTGTGAGVAVEF